MRAQIVVRILIVVKRSLIGRRNLDHSAHSREDGRLRGARGAPIYAAKPPTRLWTPASRTPHGRSPGVSAGVLLRGPGIRPAAYRRTRVT